MLLSAKWHALGGEAELAAGQIASGITALGRASHANKAHYTQAFFGLSIGLERLAKLIILADHSIGNSGHFPANTDLKKVGHDIDTILNVCQTISTKYKLDTKYATRPNDPIHCGIVTTLAEFARWTRYYNLDLITSGMATQLSEPVGAWWRRVGKPILSLHYPVHQQEIDASRSRAMAAAMHCATFVLHHTEEGDPIDDVEVLMMHNSATRVIQRYGRLYTLQIVRWMSLLISELSHVGAYVKRIEPLLGLDERFAMFINNDKYLRDRKTWSI